MNGFAKSLGVAVVALGLGVSYAPEAFARSATTWNINNNDPAKNFSITWDYYMNDYTPLTFLRLGNLYLHDERGGDFLATNEWVPAIWVPEFNVWIPDGLKWSVEITQIPGLSVSIFLQDWDPSGPSHQEVWLSITDFWDGIPQPYPITQMPTYAERKTSVPEPSSLLGLTLLGAIGSTVARKKQKPTELS